MQIRDSNTDRLEFLSVCTLFISETVPAITTSNKQIQPSSMGMGICPLFWSAD